MVLSSDFRRREGRGVAAAAEGLLRAQGGGLWWVCSKVQYGQRFGHLINIDKDPATSYGQPNIRLLLLFVEILKKKKFYWRLIKLNILLDL